MHREGMSVARCRVARLMRDLGLEGVRRGKKSALETPGRGRHRCRCLHRLRVDDGGRRLRIPARNRADPAAQPVVGLDGQALSRQRRKKAWTRSHAGKSAGIARQVMPPATR
ncbi:IS3 family transposase [Streptomyces sp. NPDC056160]|uniref:IS3 family transposase n=1 Tax=Streptomyces sp. NPDC056160 TaxID=3345731 RepID=UPI0035DAAFD9